MKQHNARTALLLTMALLAASVVPAFAYSPVEPHSPYYEVDSGKIDSAKAYVDELLKRGSDHFDTAGELRLRGLAASMDEAKAIAWEDHETASAYLSAFDEALNTIQPVKENAALVFPQEEVRMRRLLHGYFDKNEPGDEPLISYNPVWEDFNGYRLVHAYSPMERPATYDLRVGGYIYHGENQYSPSETGYMVVNAKTVVDDADDPDKYVTTFEDGLQLGIIDADRLYEISKKEKFDFTIYRAGDFDRNGNVDVTDATLVQLHAAGAQLLDISSHHYADVNADKYTYVDSNEYTDGYTYNYRWSNAVSNSYQYAYGNSYDYRRSNAVINSYRYAYGNSYDYRRSYRDAYTYDNGRCNTYRNTFWDTYAYT